MCDCINIKPQTYENEILLDPPKQNSKDKIGIDKCLKGEILNLWSKGVITGGCCCGHNIMPAIICVYDESIQLMKKLGYKNFLNTDFEFYSKSINTNNIYG